MHTSFFFFFLDFYITSTQILFFCSSLHSPSKFNCILNKVSLAFEESASEVRSKRKVALK